MSLLDLIPQDLREIREYKAIFDAFKIQFNEIDKRLSYILNQASIMGADESRTEQWESFLGIQKQGTLFQRKQFIIATLTSVGKLNEKKIEDIVNIYTNGGGCIVEVTSSAIIVKIKPPLESEQFLFPDVERTLERMKPAHLALSVIRFYSTWRDIRNDYVDWQTVKTSFPTWKDVKLYVK